jgi:hypothetical protein
MIACRYLPNVGIVSASASDPGGDEPLGMLLGDRLARHAQRLSDLWPAPARPHGLLDGGVLDAVSQPPQRRHSSQRISSSRCLTKGDSRSVRSCGRVIAIPRGELPSHADARSLSVFISFCPEGAPLAAQPFGHLIARYVDAWNDSDPVRRRSELASLYAEDGSIVTQGGVFAGIDAVIRHVAEVYDEFIAPGCYRFSSGGSVGHHDCVLFCWELREAASGELADAGMNLFLLSATGLIMGDYQFVLGVHASIGPAGSVAS